MKTQTTPLLADWQTDFAHALLGQLSDNLTQTFNATENNEKRFSIYQNNVFYSLTNALGDLYPVIKKLVGDNFFTGTAAYYLRQHPPQQAAMVYFAQDFPAFLATFEHTQTMPYLASVARLELAYHRAYHAVDHPFLSATDFANIPPEKLASAKIALHPSLQLLAEPQPIFSIWQANQEGNDSEENINLNEPQQALVVRPSYSVSIYHIDLGTHQFIQALQEKNSVQDAIEKALDIDPTFAISDAIHFALQAQLFSHIIDVNMVSNDQ
jgi:hypothetical protein